MAGPNQDERYPNLYEELVVDLSALETADRERLLTVIHRAIERNCTVERTLAAGATVDLTINDAPSTAAQVEATR